MLRLPLACYWERQKLSQAGDKQDKQDTENVFVRPPKRKRRDRVAGLVALEQRELKRFQQGTRAEIGEDDEEHMYSVTIANPLPINNCYAGGDDQEVVPSLTPLNISESGVMYSTKQGGNGTKDSKKKADKKYAAVKANLVAFKKA